MVMTAPAIAIDDLGEKTEPVDSVAVVVDDVLSGVASSRDMGHGAGEGQPKGACYGWPSRAFACTIARPHIQLRRRWAWNRRCGSGGDRESRSKSSLSCPPFLVTLCPLPQCSILSFQASYGVRTENFQRALCVDLAEGSCDQRVLGVAGNVDKEIVLAKLRSVWP